MKNITIALFVTTFIFFAGCKPKAITMGASDSGVEVKKKQTFSVPLPSNPSTGYRWFLQPTFDSTVVKLVSETYTADKVDAGVVGSGGTTLFTYKALKSGNTVITLTEGRSPQDASGKTKKINVKVK